MSVFAFHDWSKEYTPRRHKERFNLIERYNAEHNIKDDLNISIEDYQCLVGLTKQGIITTSDQARFTREEEDILQEINMRMVERMMKGDADPYEPIDAPETGKRYILLKKKSNDESCDCDAVRARREYQRRWRAANKDKVRRYNENFWRKKAEELNKQESDLEVQQ